MEKAKIYSETDLADFYVVSPVFKKYSQLNLWSDNFIEYNNIKYCEIYLSQYFLGCAQKYILEYFSESFLLTLYNSPKFVKFIRSGFFKYINRHFLLFFQSNRFFFFRDSYKEVETFVEEYFQRYIKFFFEQDLLRCLVVCVTELVPSSFKEYLTNRLTFIYKDLLLIESNTKPLSNSVVILNFIESEKKECYPLGFVNYKDTIKIFSFARSKANGFSKRENSGFFSLKFTYKIYKSFKLSKEVPDVLISIFLLEDTVYSWGPCLIDTYKKVSCQIFNYILFDLAKASAGYKFFFFKKELKFPLKICSSFFSKDNWCFYTFSKRIYKAFNRVTYNLVKKDSHNYNHDFHFLLESYQILVGFDRRRNDIGIYRASVNVFFEDIKPMHIKLVHTSIRGGG
uniref:Uncharacterized protein n=1 Tax=Thalassiophyllum clathrus TaxID=112506 RepID=A0A8F0K0W1_9PHAE|nr:hypothetical protein [Thalassiophyllum clathrus]